MALLGQGWEDPKSAAIMALAGGLLRGDMGGGFLGANDAYGQAKANGTRAQLAQLQMQEAQMKMEEAARQRQFLQNLPMQGNNPLLHQAAQAGAIPLGDYLKSTMPKQIDFGKINPSDYTPESLREAVTTGDHTKLVPVRKMEVGPGGQVYNPWQVAPGTVMNDPLKPFLVGPGGQLVPNTPVQQYEKDKARAGASSNNIVVNTEKNLLGGVADAVSGGIKDARSGAQAALGTIGTVNRLMDALDSNQVMAGPGTTFRQYGLQVGNLLGISGKDAQEKLLNTRQAIQSLAQLELDAAQQMRGQGQITEAERAIIRRAASGDIDGMTTSELRLLGNVLDRTARTKIKNYQGQVAPLKNNPNAAPLTPFLDIAEPPARQQQGGVRRYNPATGRIE